MDTVDLAVPAYCLRASVPHTAQLHIILMLKTKIKRRKQTEFHGGDTLDPLLRQLYASRGACDQQAVDTQLASLCSPELLGGIVNAVVILHQALNEDQRILIVGDYDADGATSTALAIKALKSMGSVAVDYLLPNRFEDGYGLSSTIVEKANKERSPNLIITVDNGISSIDGVAAANALGIKVLITDHHLPGDVLPQAAAIINPNLCGDGFPSKSLAGVGVIFYLMLALRAYLESCGWFVDQNIPKPNMAELLDLVALGTVADVVPLDKNNRVLVEQGLRRIRASACSAGISALIKVANCQQLTLAASDLGYSIAPRINAAGRLDSMSLGVECLLAKNEEQALKYAEQLDQLNIERRLIETDMREQAQAQVDCWLGQSKDQKDLPVALSLYEPEWHQGVLGIVAGRLKDQLNRPVIAFGLSGDNVLKGSARSIPGLHIRDVLSGIVNRHPALIDSFGGHAMAAGLTIPLAELTTFSTAFEAEVIRQLGLEPQNKIIVTDGPLTLSQMTVETAALIKIAGPWGQHFPEPVFDNNLELDACRVVGAGHLKMQLKGVDVDCFFDAIYFNPPKQLYESLVLKKTYQFVYSLDVNEYRNSKTLQLIIRHIQAA